MAIFSETLTVFGKIQSVKRCKVFYLAFGSEAGCNEAVSDTSEGFRTALQLLEAVDIG